MPLPRSAYPFEGVEMLAEGLVALASLAGRTVVAAAVTDAWEAARRGFARLLGRGDPRQTRAGGTAAGRQAREQLSGVAAADLERGRSGLQARGGAAARRAGRASGDSELICRRW